jgi:hypothetical protein
VDPALLVTIALVVLVLVLLVVRVIVRRKLNEAIADAPRKRTERLGSDAEQLGVALAFDDPIAGRSVVGRALEGGKLATTIGDDLWRVGVENIGGVDAHWVVLEGRGVLRATRTITLASSLAGAGNWTRTLAAVEKVATSEGVTFSRLTGVFVDSGEKQKSEQVWVRAGA